MLRAHLSISPLRGYSTHSVWTYGRQASRQLVWNSWEAWDLKVLRDGLKRWFVGVEEGKVPVDRPQRVNRRS